MPRRVYVYGWVDLCNETDGEDIGEGKAVRKVRSVSQKSSNNSRGKEDAQKCLYFTTFQRAAFNFLKNEKSKEKSRGRKRVTDRQAEKETGRAKIIVYVLRCHTNIKGMKFKSRGGERK